jgi:hypothetical protein
VSGSVSKNPKLFYMFSSSAMISSAYESLIASKKGGRSSSTYISFLYIPYPKAVKEAPKNF